MEWARMTCCKSLFYRSQLRQSMVRLTMMAQDDYPIHLHDGQERISEVELVTKWSNNVSKVRWPPGDPWVTPCRLSQRRAQGPTWAGYTTPRLPRGPAGTRAPIERAPRPRSARTARTRRPGPPSLSFSGSLYRFEGWPGLAQKGWGSGRVRFVRVCPGNSGGVEMGFIGSGSGFGLGLGLLGFGSSSWGQKLYTVLYCCTVTRCGTRARAVARVVPDRSIRCAPS